jgi:hypothetical protein
VVVGIEVARCKCGELEVVRSPRRVAGLLEVLGNQLVQPQAFALGQARVGDLTQRRVAQPPSLRGAALIPHHNFGVLELADLINVHSGIDDGELTMLNA